MKPIDEKIVEELKLLFKAKKGVWDKINEYLDKNRISGERREQIVKALADYDRALFYKKHNQTNKYGRIIEKVLGIILILAGIVLMFYLWDLGFVASVPFVLIIGGLTIFVNGSRALGVFLGHG